MVCARMTLPTGFVQGPGSALAWETVQMVSVLSKMRRPARAGEIEKKSLALMLVNSLKL